MIDSFVATTDRGDREIIGRSPERLEIQLTGFMPVASPAVQSLLNAPELSQAEAGAIVAGSVSRGDVTVDVQLEFINLQSGAWSPSLTGGSIDREALGIYVSEMAAQDLGVGVGDEVSLRHPRLQTNGNVTLVDTRVAVLGIHPHPFRFVAYADVTQSSLLGDVPLANSLSALPAAGKTLDEVKRDLFNNPSVASVRHVGDTAAAIRDLLDEFIVVLRVVEFAMLLIALLIAFNSASIGIDERAREHATMFAFGIPVGTVMRLAVFENLLVGLLSTAGGLLGGWLLLQGIITTRIRDTMPDIYIQPVVSNATLAIAIFLGVFMVAAAPLLIWRRLISLNIPATLKVVE
jgi:putative ABC transport system permease protein